MALTFKMERLPDWETDTELVAAATVSLQAHERLNHQMRSKLKNKLHAETALAECSTVLDELRQLKSKIEGTYFKFQPIQLQHNKLIELKHLVVAYTPATLHELNKAKIAEKLAEIFDGQVKKLVYVCILTCPWFAHAQNEVSAQAKNNLLFVVFVGSDEQFFSLATHHEKELSETIDAETFMFATEVRHFCAQLQKGNVRCVEALCAPPESLVLCTPEWFGLAGLVDPVALLQRSFVERCLGQAVGALVRKKKVREKLVLRDDTTLTKFCDSFRLLSYAECAVRRVPLCPWVELQTDSGEYKDIFTLLQEGFEGVVQREKLLESVLGWRERVEGGAEGLPKRGPDWTVDLGRWLAAIRMDSVKITQPPAPLPSEQEKLRQLFSSLGIPSLDPSNVLVMAKCGSHMYGLSTPTSDTDYIIAFREPTETMISSCTSPNESLDNRGKHLKEEVAAYEARLFCEMLLKGAVNIFELLFADQVVYASEAWKELTSHRELFMSEKVILQYLGYVQTHMSIIESGKHAGKPREGKIFYHIFHKLLSLERFVHCQPPVVRCTGEEKEFILKVRKGPLEGELSKEKLYALAQQRLAAVREHLRNRTVRLPEYGDYRFLQTWLLGVRGVCLKEPLKLATPPLLG